MPRSLRPDAPAVFKEAASAGARDPGAVERSRRLLLPLTAADAERDGTLCSTLRTYYANGGSMTKTAEAMFLHRNSVRYRLDRVRSVLGIDIDHPENAAALLMAFAILDAATQAEAGHAALGA
jgi:purine catabolism regulator